MLKFFGWGKDGWLAKLEAFETLTNEDGTKIFQFPDGLPIINDAEIWASFEALLPDEHYYSDFLDRVKEPVPLGGSSAPGFQTFLDEVYFGGEYGDVKLAIINGEVNAHDIAPDLTKKLINTIKMQCHRFSANKNNRKDSYILSCLSIYNTNICFVNEGNV